MLIICVLILAYMMVGKNIEPLLEKVKNIDWKERCREACEKCLQAWYVLDDPKTPMLDKVLIYAAIIYTVSPWSVIPFVKFRIFGALDELAAINFVIKRISKNITPAIELKAKEKMEEWFGPDYSVKGSEA